MNINDLMNLEHTIFEETENFVYITPEEGYALDIEDTPEDEILTDKIEMLKQDEYSNVSVICIDPSILDTSVS